MAVDRETRLPTAWIDSCAARHHAVAHQRWVNDSIQVVLTGHFGPHPWVLTLDGHLDTDYVATGRLRCQVPGRARFSASTGSRASPTGTEADLVFAVLGAARSWWRGRGSRPPVERSGGPQDATGVADHLRIDDVHGVLTAQIRSLLAVWPASTHARGARHTDRVAAAFSTIGASLDIDTENLWGEAVVDHHLQVARLLVDRLLTTPGGD